MIKCTAHPDAIKDIMNFSTVDQRYHRLSETECLMFNRFDESVGFDGLWDWDISEFYSVKMELLPSLVFKFETDQQYHELKETGVKFKLMVHRSGARSFRARFIAHVYGTNEELFFIKCKFPNCIIEERGTHHKFKDFAEYRMGRTDAEIVEFHHYD